MSNPDLCGVRKLSPREVFNSGAGNLTKFQGHQIALLLGLEHAREIKVRNHLLSFEDRELLPSPLHYLARVERAGYLPDGESFSAVVNPFDLSELHLFDARGGYLGSCERETAVCRADAEALHRACGRAAKIEADLLAPVAQRGAGVTRQRIADMQHNTAVLRGSPITETEKRIEADAREIARESGREGIATILERDEEPEADELPTSIF